MLTFAIWKQLNCEHIGLVPQEAALFSSTVRENIAFGRPDASHDKIVDAAQKAQADEFISSQMGVDGITEKVRFRVASVNALLLPGLFGVIRVYYCLMRRRARWMHNRKPRYKMHLKT